MRQPSRARTVANRGVLSAILCLGGVAAAADRIDASWNADWRFARDVAAPAADTPWESVTLPHTARLEPLHLGARMWMGDCVYRKTLVTDPAWTGKKVLLRFDGAMHTATVTLDGRELAKHHGGYLPFTVDLTDALKSGATHTLTVHLDNRDNPEVPPGTPFKKLDFAWYHGLYRGVRLVVTDPLRITDPVAENLPGGGGVRVSYPAVTADAATVLARVHVRNDRPAAARPLVRCTLTAPDGTRVVAETVLPLAAGAAEHAATELRVPQPKLWSPQSPALHTLVTEIILDGVTVDSVATTCGIRSAVCDATHGFVLNGKKQYLRGTNRHQEFPYLGYALSDAAQWRDAYKIKRAGFDLVRPSHYPQSPAFLDACDHYGIVVMEPTPGWQFYRDGRFAERSLQDARDMIRRDRNHPSCLFWETSLNETTMPAPFLRRQHEIAKEEGGPGTFSASHTGKFHDVFIPARQHTSGPAFWDAWKDRDRAIFTAEYGDWEYLTHDLASNFDQDKPGVKLRKEETTSRQLRGHGEARMLRQARNFQEAHHRNHRNPAMVGDANWLFNDYNRGMHADHCSSGVVDIFRLPKFVRHFYAAQRDATGEFMAEPTVFIASFHDQKSSPRVRVFSNGDAVELFQNGVSLGRQKPDADDIAGHIPHPPFTFLTRGPVGGELRAVAYLRGLKIAEHTVRTPGAPAALRLTPDLAGHPLAKDGKDTLLVYAEITDAAGTVVPDAATPVTFRVTGATLASPATVNAEAGIATAVVVTAGDDRPVAVTAEAATLAPATTTLGR